MKHEYSMFMSPDWGFSNFVSLKDVTEYTSFYFSSSP